MEKANANANQGASVTRNSEFNEVANATGVYHVTCVDADGNIKWEDTAINVVTTEGKNLALDTYLAGSGYTVTGPYMGLIAGTGYTAVAATDTYDNINQAGNGWDECGGATAPLYTGTRKTCAWSAASGGSKSLSASLSFVIATTGGTVKGCFIAYGTGAVNTKDDHGATGVLYSAGLFTGGDKVVADTDTLNVSYTASL